MGTVGGVNSKFRFLSYKIDHFNLDMLDAFELLLYKGSFDSEDWEYQYSFDEPILHKKNDIIITGIKCDGRLHPEKVEEELVTFSISITGAFQFEGVDFDKDSQINNIIKYQLPTILLGYLRASLTSFMANAGFGTFILPLINLIETIKQVEREKGSLELKVIE